MKTRSCLFAATLVALLTTATAPAQNLNLIWALDPGSRPYLPASPGDDSQRGMTFNPVTRHLLLVSRTGGLQIRILDAADGADLGALNTNGIAGGTFILSMIGVAADGAIYAANLASPTSVNVPLKIYRWANEGAAPTVAYSDVVVLGTRWGDNFDVRGGGNNTQVLLGMGSSGGTAGPPGHRLAVFTTVNGGATLTPVVLTLTTNVPGGQVTAGDTRGGVAFGPGNSAYFKTAGGTTLRYAGFDLAAPDITVLSSPALPTGLSGFGPLGSGVSGSFLGAIQVNTAVNPHTVAQNIFLFNIATPAAPAVLDSKPFINPGLRNLNAAGAVEFDESGAVPTRVFALDANNGLRAFCLDSTPPVMNCPPGISVTASNVPGAAGAVVDYGVTATDNSGGPIGIVCDPPSGSFLPVGTFGVICTAVDGCGNASRCNFPVTVNRPPVPWFFQTNVLPPSNGMYVSPAQWHALYANGIILSNVIHRRFTQGILPPPPNGSLTHNFGSVVEFDVSMDGGLTFLHEIASADVSVGLHRMPDAGTTQTFDTEMLQLNIAGGSLPAAVRIRESPTRPSLGRTEIVPVPGGYMIDSFFDIFTELSVDGGQTWSPSALPAHVELMTDPTTVPAVQEPSSFWPPQMDQFVTLPQQPLVFPGGIALRNLQHKLFGQALDLEGIGLGGTQFLQSDSQLDFQYSTDGGQTFRSARAPAFVMVQLDVCMIGRAGSFFDTEMLQLNIAGGDLPSGVMIRESPTLPSRGGTALTLGPQPVPWRMNSFFDVFTEISLDGGQTWQPSTTGPAHLELQNITLPHPFPTPDWPPPNGQLASAPSWRALYGQGVLLSNLVWHDITPSLPPPPPGGNAVQDLTSQVDGMFSVNGGQTFTPFQAPAFGMMRLTSLVDDGNTRFFDTEMLQLNISGGTLPAGMFLRESPTRASLGRTSMTQDSASGQFRINSFFDIFTEMSLNGGQSWNPASEAIPAGLRPPPPFAPFVIHCPGDLSEIASGSSGAVVNYFTTIGIYPDCPFGPFTVTCVPPSGSVFPVGTTTVTCTGSDGCGEHPTCSFKVKVLPQSSIIYKGFLNSVIGSAVLLPFNPGTGAPASSLLISNISLSGLDGFKIEPGPVDGIAVDFLPFSLLQITSTVSTAISPLGEVLGVSTLLGGSNEMVQADFSTLGSETSLLQVSDGLGHLLSSSLIPNGTWLDINQIFPCPNGSSYYTTYQGPDRAWYRFCRAGCNCIGTNCFVERIICLRALAPSKVAPLASLNIVVQPWSGGILGTSLPPTGVSSGLRAAGANNAFALTVINERVQKFGNLHSSKGAARISSDGQRLLVGNLGSSGEDGVAIDFMNGPGGGGGVSRFDMNVDPLNLWTLGTCLRLASFGRFNDVAGVSLGTASLVCAVGPGGGCLDASVDFKAIGATRARVDVLQGGQIVGTTVVPTGLIGRIFGQGNIIGCGKLPPPLPCFWIQFDAPFNFVGSDNKQFTGTELRILAADPAGAVQDLTQFCVQGCNLGQLAIIGETTPPPIEVDHFSFSTAVLTLQLAGGGTETVHLAGPSTMDVQIGPGGESADTDGDGLDQVSTEMMALDLTGIGPTVGTVRLTLDPAQMTFGEIEETGNNTPGIMDVAPFAATGTASSFFDVFPIIEIAGVPYHPAQRLHWQTLITHKPPAPGETYVNPSQQPIPLLDPTGKPSGLSLVGQGYTPNASNCIQLLCPTNTVVTTCKTDGRRVDYPVSATNRCNGRVTVACIPASGANFPVGTTIVNCTAYDAAGNSVSCKFPVTVQYCQQPPQILCPSNIVTWTCLAAGLKVDYAPTVISPCDSNVTVVCNPPSGSTFPPGTTVVTCQVRDACGRSSTCEFQVTVIVDITPPVINCPSNFAVRVCSANQPVTWTVTATDDCTPSVAVVCNPPSGSVLPSGVTTVTCVARDDCGNTSQCKFDVLVCRDVQPPVINCPSNITRWVCAGVNGIDVPYSVTASDDCTAAAGISVVCVPPPGSLFPIGSTTVNCVATDACGKSNSCSFVVTIIRDVTPPVITCPSNIVIACGDPAGTPVTWITSATDDCDTNVTLTCVPPSGSSFPVGSTTVTCTALDACGNRSSCAFRVTINGSGGPPTVCPNPAVVVFTAGTTNDNFVGPEPASPSVGLVTRLTMGGGILKGFDDCTVNRTFAHSFTNLPPCVTEAILRIRIRGCGDLVRNDAIGLNFVRPNGSAAAPGWGRYLGSGNAAPGLMPTPWSANSVQEFVLDLSALPLPGGGTTDLIPTLANLGFLDVTVQDDSAVDYVILTVKSCCCRNDIVVNAPANACCAPVTYTLPVFTNDCGGPITVQCQPPSGFCFPVGSTLVTCTGTDAAGQVGRCFFKVIVRDAIPPVIVFCPTNLIACIDGANSGVMPDLVPRVIATDNCTPAAELIITQNPPPGTIVTGGNVTFTVTDAAGNSTICTQPMIVEPCCVPPPSGLVLWLPFDENAGLTAFNAAGGNNGQLQNGPTRNSAGYVVRSLCFDGVNDVVVVPSYGAIDMGTSDFSIDAWIRRDPQSGNTVRVIVDKRFAQTGIGYSLAMSFGNLVFQLADAGGFTNFRDTAVVPADNQWHFVAVTVCRSLTNGGQFFVDGAPTANFNPTVRPGNLNNPGAFLVGRSPIAGNSPWLGCIDEVEVFRRCLQPQEIRRIYNAGDEGKCRTRCTLPWDVAVCLGRTSVVVTATICNPSPTPQTYNFQFHGLPPGPGCNFPGPTSYSPASGTITVPPGGCVSFPVTIGVPPGMPCGAIACYEMVVVPQGTRQRFACEGSIYRSCQVCPRPPNTRTNIVGGGVVNVGSWQLDNSTGGPIDLTGARLRAIGPDMEPDMRVISLNGLPPGVPWEVPPGLILPPGGGGAGGLIAAGAGGIQLPMDVQFTEPDPGQTYTILLEADLDGDGQFEVLASMDVENSVAAEGLLQAQSNANGTFTLTWPAGWVLEHNDDAANPAGWSDAPQQTSPLTLSPAGAKKFYRLRQ